MTHFTDEEIVEFIFTDLRLQAELPNHCQAEETRAILADYSETFPELYAKAETKHAKYVKSIGNRPAPPSPREWEHSLSRLGV